MGTHGVLCSVSCQPLLSSTSLCSQVNVFQINEAFVLNQETIYEYTFNFNDLFMINCFNLSFFFLEDASKMQLFLLNRSPTSGS